MCLIAFGFALPLFGGIEMYLCSVKLRKECNLLEMSVG